MPVNAVGSNPALPVIRSEATTPPAPEVAAVAVRNTGDVFEDLRSNPRSGIPGLEHLHLPNFVPIFGFNTGGGNGDGGSTPPDLS